MTGYQVIAKKFRPQTFSEVFEQMCIVQTLKNAMRLKKVGHAYLFCGTRGTGKTTLARLFAKAINCEALTSDEEPCNQCRSCREIISGSSLDVIEIDGASNRGIDDIRSINETAPYAASNGKYKIYIIDEVHMLTKEAFNALLKTLEEPPSHVIFFFATTEPHKVLPTILSRCQRFDLKRIPPEAIEAKLAFVAQKLSVDIEEGALKILAKHAEGSLRDGESLLDQLICFEKGTITRDHALKALGLIQTDFFFQLDQAALKHDLPTAFSLSATLFEEGAHLHHIIESLTEHFRTIAMVQMGTPPPLPEYATSATIYSKHQTLEILDYLISALEKGQRTPFKQIHLEVIFLHIIQSVKKIPLASLVERLENLKGETTKETQERPIEKAPLLKNQTPIPEPTLIAPPPAPTIKEKIRHEQVMRFASVELSGILKK